MKRLLCAALALLLVLSLCACADGGTKPAEGSGTPAADTELFIWSPTYDGQIDGYTDAGRRARELTIPADCTLAWGLGDNGTVETLSFAGADTELAAAAFSNCTALKKVTLPDHLTELPDSAFLGCTALEEVVIPASVTAIGDGAFMGCTGLRSVTFLGDQVKTVGDNAFDGCEALREITFREGLERIGDGAFRNCAALESVKLPEGLTTLGEQSFAFCDGLKELFLPATLTQVEFNSIVQSHDIAVYVVRGSEMDARLGELQGAEYYQKDYQ